MCRLQRHLNFGSCVDMMTVHEEDGIDGWERARTQEIGPRKFSDEAMLLCQRHSPSSSRNTLLSENELEVFLRQNMLFHIATRQYQDLPGRIRRLCGQHAYPSSCSAIVWPLPQ